MKKIAIYGAGGFGKEIACLINHINSEFLTWDFIGFFDDGLPKGFKNKFGTVLGGIQDLNSYSEELGIVISVASPTVIEDLSGKIDNQLVYFPNLIAPNVLFLDKASMKIGKGNVVFFSCRISCDVTIGNFNLLNSMVSLGHDVVTGDYNVIGPSSRISGETTIGNANFFGVQSTVLQGLKIGNRTRVGAGSVIMRNTKNDALYLGNPAKRIVF
ncbi:MAG: acetyltransferase [Imperialibacter sp.]|uniref:acetyltransferase n=1 Tax=Imperialibacter sp. TaxID=2038411 RepID=UPI0032EDB92A